MNSIHSSSLAFYPAGYIKPDTNAFDKNQGNQAVVDNEAGNERQTQKTPASTPKQIEAAITDAGLTIDNRYDQPTNARAAKALAAYTQTRNQPIQAQIADTFVGLDLFA